nr:MAG TPA: hypothetical protein [Microviridae sp.]
MKQNGNKCSKHNRQSVQTSNKKWSRFYRLHNKNSTGRWQ